MTMYGNEKTSLVIIKHVGKHGYLWFWIMITAIIIGIFLLSAIAMTIFLRKYNGRDSLRAIFANDYIKSGDYYANFIDQADRSGARGEQL